MTQGISNFRRRGMVVEQVKQIGNYETESTWDNPQTGRVYSADGISPTLNTCNGGDRQPKILMIRKALTEQEFIKICVQH